MSLCSMATLTIRNLPDAIHEKLKVQARTNRRSVNQEVIATLEERVLINVSKEDRFTVITQRADKLRATMTGFLTSSEIEEAITEGRN